MNIDSWSWSYLIYVAVMLNILIIGFSHMAIGVLTWRDDRRRRQRVREILGRNGTGEQS